VERILKYLETDTICYTIPLQKEAREDHALHSGASDLVKLQKRMAEQWAPVVSGFADYHKVEIVTNDYQQILLENEQKKETVEYFRRMLMDEKKFSVWRLTALLVAVQSLKSFVLAMELVTTTKTKLHSRDRTTGRSRVTTSTTRLDPKAAYELSMLEEAHQREFWGDDDPSFLLQKTSHLRWLEACQKFAVTMQASSQQRCTQKMP